MIYDGRSERRFVVDAIGLIDDDGDDGAPRPLSTIGCIIRGCPSSLLLVHDQINRIRAKALCTSPADLA